MKKCSQIKWPSDVPWKQGVAGSHCSPAGCFKQGRFCKKNVLVVGSFFLGGKLLIGLLCFFLINNKIQVFSVISQLI